MPLASLALARSGAIRVPLSAPDACSRLRPCAASSPSGGLDEKRVAEIQQRRLDPDLTCDQPKSVPVKTKSELKRAAAGGPRHARDAISATFVPQGSRGRDWCDQGFGVLLSWHE